MSMAIGIVFLVMVAFVIPGAAVLGAVYCGYLMETRPPPGHRARVVEREPGALRTLVVVEPTA